MKAQKLFPVMSVFFIALFLFSCSIETFSEFSVVDVSVAKNGVIGTGRQPIEVLFSKRVNRKSAESSVHIEKESAGDVAFTLNVSGKKMLLEPEEEWSPHERFWLVIDKSIKDEYGRNMGKDYYFVFQSTGELMPVSAVLVMPEIGDGIVSTDTDYLEIVFSSGIDRGSVEREFSISPSVDGYFEWASNCGFRYHFLENLKKNTLYSVKIPDSAIDEDGYKIRLFIEEFEYFPNRSYPEIKEIICDLDTIFDMNDPETYRIEDGDIIIECNEVNKDPFIRITFSDAPGEGWAGPAAPVDRSVFRENVELFPDTGWHETWFDDYTVEIGFEETLMLDRKYEIAVNRGIKNTDGLNLLYRYLIELQIRGAESRLLDFYADDFISLEIGAEAMSGPEIIPGVVSSLEKDEAEGGCLINIMAQDFEQPGDVDVNLAVMLRFYYRGIEVGEATPIIDKLSLQDSTVFSCIFCEGGNAAEIRAFEWSTGGGGEEPGNECLVIIKGARNEDIYRLSIGGGRDGVVDIEKNYMEKDIEYYFKIKITSSGPQ